VYLKKIKNTGFKIQNYIPRTHEMKNRIGLLSKNKGCLFFLLPKIYQLPEYYTMFARKYFFSQVWGGGQLPPVPPVSYAYDCIVIKSIVSISGILTIVRFDCLSVTDLDEVASTPGVLRLDWCSCQEDSQWGDSAVHDWSSSWPGRRALSLRRKDSVHHSAKQLHTFDYSLICHHFVQCSIYFK